MRYLLFTLAVGNLLASVMWAAAAQPLRCAIHAVLFGVLLWGADYE